MNTTPVESLEALYAELPNIDCRRLCSEACGPILMSRVEWDRILNRKRREPRMKSLAEPCPMLRHGRCTVYDVRPMICRLWGLVESMPCVYGCKPDRVLTDEEGREFLRRAEEVGA